MAIPLLHSIPNGCVTAAYGVRLIMTWIPAFAGTSFARLAHDHFSTASSLQWARLGSLRGVAGAGGTVAALTGAARASRTCPRGKPLPPRGPIQLQTHGGEIRWRNIFIREIKAEK